MPQTKGWFDTKPFKLHGCPPHLAGMYRGTRGHCRTKPNLGRPSGGVETLGKLLRGGDFPLLGGLDVGEWPPLMSGTQCKGPWPMLAMWGPGFQKHGPRCCFLTLPSSSWVFGLGVGRALPQTKGWFDTKPFKLHGWTPHLAGMYMGTRGHCRTKPNLGRPLVVEKPWESCSERGDFPPWGGWMLGNGLP